MSRWVIAIALSWSAWVAAQPAVAHARPLLSTELGLAMCGDGSQTVSWEDLTLSRALSQGSQGSQGSHGVLAVSVAEDSAAAMPLRTAVAEEDEAPPAWCISPDDPRCSPRDQSAPLDGPRGQVPMQDVTAMRWPDLAAESGNGLRPEQLGAARAGVALLIERPPRG